MLETLIALAADHYIVSSISATIGAEILAWILYKAPSGDWSKKLAEKGENHGNIIINICRVKIPFWNKLIEPLIIDTISLVVSYIAGFIIGLKSDN